MLAPLAFNLLIACTLILLAGWMYDSIVYGAGDGVGHASAPSSAHTASGPAWFVARNDLAGWAWHRGMNRPCQKDVERLGWWVKVDERAVVRDELAPHASRRFE